jgi:hypothetical protein
MITVQCTCGKTFSVVDHFAGKTAQCPDCKATVQIPPGPQAAAATPEPAPQAAAATPEPAPQAPAPAPAPAPAAQAQAFPSVPQQAPQPAPGYYQPQAPEAQPRPGGGRWRIIICCILVLLTGVVPWQILKGQDETNIFWSWDFLKQVSQAEAPEATYIMAYVIGAWAAALLIFIFALIFRGLGLSIPLLLLSGAAVVVMILGWEHWGLEAWLKYTGRMLSRKEWVKLAALLSSLGLFWFAGIRGRVGRSITVAILEAATAAACLTFVAIVFIPSVDKFRTIVEDTPPKMFFTDWPLPHSGLLVGMALVLLGGLVALIHGLVVTARARVPSRIATFFMGLAALVILLTQAALPAAQERFSGSLTAAVQMILYFAMPALLLGALIRFPSDIILAVRKGS